MGKHQNWLREPLFSFAVHLIHTTIRRFSFFSQWCSSDAYDDHDIYGLEMLCTPSLRLRFFARRWGVWIHGTAAASGWFPSIVRGTVLEEAGILAERVARRIELGVGLAEEFARPQCFIVNLVHQLLVTVVVLEKSRERTQIVVADNHDIHARHRR